MTDQIESAIRAFERIILSGVPHLLTQNETAFLSFMCCLAAIDALAAYRFRTKDKRFQKFIAEYFPRTYNQHAANLWLLRCRILHNFSPAYFTLTHAEPAHHLGVSPIGDTVLSDGVFFSDLKEAAHKFFAEVRADPKRQADMDARLSDIDNGGAIYTFG